MPTIQSTSTSKARSPGVLTQALGLFFGDYWLYTVTAIIFVAYAIFVPHFTVRTFIIHFIIIAIPCGH